MTNISTPDQNATNIVTVTKSKKTAPKKSTVEFLRQFARCYKYESQIDSAIAGLIVN